MVHALDGAILKTLSLKPSTTTIASHGGSGFSSTYKVTSTSDGEEKSYFVKTGAAEGSRIMFAGEHTSLNAIHDIVPSLCPRSHAYGRLEDGSGFFLVTDFLNLGARTSRSASTGSGLSLAQKLARLHSKTAPIPDGYDNPVFGFPVTTCCGDTEQDNSYNPSWADFYANSRLRAVYRVGEKRNGEDQDLAQLVEATASKVVPALLGDGHLKDGDGGKVLPVIVHGDLWSGNHGSGVIGDGPVEEVVFDPSASYSHSEFDFGIMQMFGGFGASFEKDYYEAKGNKDEPALEWADRVKLYELYHHLNHYAIFGRSYKSGAASIMIELNKKYGT